SPPEHGHLRAALLSLSHKRYEHPISGEPMRIGFSTLEAWYYAALRGDNPFTELRRKVRKDAGVARVVSARVLEVIGLQYAQHPSWSYKLHYKNLQARAEGDATLLPLPSYPTLRRAMKAQGLVRRKRRTDYRVEHGPREVRSYEKAHAHALWHLD